MSDDKPVDAKLLGASLGRLAPLGAAASRPMFGGHGLLVDEVLVALCRDGRLYVKSSTEHREFRPFPGRQLRLRFSPVADPCAADWLFACARALAEVRALAARVPRASPYRAVRVDS